jgi:hypothetical protein
MCFHSQKGEVQFEKQSQQRELTPKIREQCANICWGVLLWTLRILAALRMQYGESQTHVLITFSKINPSTQKTTNWRLHRMIPKSIDSSPSKSIPVISSHNVGKPTDKNENNEFEVELDFKFTLPFRQSNLSSAIPTIIHDLGIRLLKSSEAHVSNKTTETFFVVYQHKDNNNRALRWTTGKTGYVLLSITWKK